MILPLSPSYGNAHGVLNSPHKVSIPSHRLGSLPADLTPPSHLCPSCSRSLLNKAFQALYGPSDKIVYLFCRIRPAGSASCVWLPHL